jgi:hypothetical protein
MAETTDQVRSEIALTRYELANTIDEISARIEATRRSIPFYGMQRRQIMVIAGGAAAVVAVVFLAFYARKRF